MLGPGEAPVGDEGPERSLLAGDEGPDAFFPTGDDGCDPFLAVGEAASLGDEGPGDAVLSSPAIVRRRRNLQGTVCGVQI